MTESTSRGTMRNPIAQTLWGRVPLWFSATMNTIGIATAFLSMLFYIGTYRWMTELQMSVLGAFDWKASLILSMVCHVALVAAIVHATLRLGLVKALQHEREIKSYPDIRTTPIQARHIAAYGIPIAIAGLSMWGMGLWYLRGSQSPSPLDVADLLQGRTPSTSYLSITGVPLYDAATIYGRIGSEDAYVPLVASSWTPAMGFHAFVQLPKLQIEGLHDSSNRVTYTGMVYPGGIPGPVRGGYDRTGIKLNSPILVCEGATPGEWRAFVHVGGVASAVVLIAGIIALLVDRTRRHKLTVT